jgi:hypothetical protein
LSSNALLERARGGERAFGPIESDAPITAARPTWHSTAKRKHPELSSRTKRPAPPVGKRLIAYQEKIMLAKKSAELLLLLVLSTIPTWALARASSEPVTPTSAKQFSEAELAAIRQEIKVFANARISVRDAIEIAEKTCDRAVRIDLSDVVPIAEEYGDGTQ